MADITDAVRNLHNPLNQELFQTSSESIYGFGKCELKNSYRYHGPGMMGMDAMLAGQKFGRLLRKRYDVFDLTSYRGDFAEQWAERPKTTHGVPDSLEPEASNHKIPSFLEVTDCNTAAALIEQGYPVGYCGISRWGIQTDDLGQATNFSSGAHAMALTGVKYNGKTPTHFWVANTGHGDHVRYNGKFSGIPKTYSSCGSWITSEIIRPVLVDGDCFAISVDGFWHKHELLASCFLPESLI